MDSARCLFGTRLVRLVRLFGYLVCALSLGCSSDSSAPPADGSVSGRVVGNGAGINATVFLIPAAEVAASMSLQPLEDCTSSATTSASTDADGRFSVSLPPGRYFLFARAAISGYLPGGSVSRSALVVDSGEALTDLTVELSDRPPEDAAYVGSSRCLECHADASGHMRTLHSIGLRRVTAAGSEPSSLQDLSQFPVVDAGLAYFADGNPHDNTGGGDGFGYRVDSNEGYSILLGRDAAGFFQAVESDDQARVSEPLYVEFSYGGEGLFKQLYVTRLSAQGRHTADATLGTYQVLPAQFSETRGDVGRGEVTVPAWTDYDAEHWEPPAVDGDRPLRVPEPRDSFDNRCAGCHFTGMSLTRSGDGLFQAHAVADPGGPFDYDGDGNLDEMNVGCERCHGPGSQHAQDRGGSIVQPQYLSPGRAQMLCGQCHIRGRGNALIDGDGGGDYPARNDALSGAVEFFTPGQSPAEFFGTPSGRDILPHFGTSGGFLDTVDLAVDDSASWRDRPFGSDFDHSKQQRQHYFDHVRSAHALNERQIVVCFDCHDAHDRTFAAQLVAPADNNVLCFDCHSGRGDFDAVEPSAVADPGAGQFPAAVRQALNSHVLLRTFDQIGVAMNIGPAPYGDPGSEQGLGRCTLCHMPRTARSAEWVRDLDGFVVRGDISSHTFGAISPKVSEEMHLDGSPAVLNSCVACHRGVAFGSWPDYRFTEEP